MTDAVSAAGPRVILSLLALVVVLIRVVVGKEPRRWSRAQRRYLAPLMFGVACFLCLSGALQLWVLTRGAPIVSARAFVGCGYVVLGAFIVWNMWWHRPRGASSHGSGQASRCDV